MSAEPDTDDASRPFVCPACGGDGNARNCWMLCTACALDYELRNETPTCPMEIH